jgi:hypothetical protein
MAEWQYRIHHLELGTTGDFDQTLETTLAQYGADGWELVEVLDRDLPVSYSLIFKSPKPLD